MAADTAASYVSKTSLPLVRTVAASLPHLRPVVMDHPDLEEDLWFSFYRTKKLPPAGQARSLTARTLSGAQIDYVIERESRSKVLVGMVKHNRFSAAQLDALTAAKGCTAPVVEALLSSQPETLSRTWLREAGIKAGGAVLLEYMCQATPAEMSDEEMSEHLTRYSEWGPTWEQVRMTKLIHHRPSIIPAIIASGHSQFLTAVAGSRLLTDVETQYQAAGLRDPEATDPSQVWLDAHAFTWLALVWNPVCALEVVNALSPMLERQNVKPDAWGAATQRLRGKPAPVDVPFDQVTDPAQLSWLVHRTISKPRPEDLEALVANPHLGTGETDKLITGIQANPALSALMHAGSPVDTHVTALVETLPENVAVHYREWLVNARSEAALMPEQAEAERDSEWRTHPTPCTEEELERAGGFTVNVLSYNRAAQVRLETLVEDNASAWLFVLTNVDTFSGTVDDLASVANAIAASST